MHAPASRRQPFALSRMLSLTRSARAERGLGDVLGGVVHGVSSVVHDASDVAHDVGHAVDDALRGQVSKLPGDLVKTGIDVVNTGKDAFKAVHGVLSPSSGYDSGGAGTGSDDPNAGGGGEGAPQPTPTPNPGAGGGEGEAPTASRSVSSSTATSPTSPSYPSSGYPGPAPSQSAIAVPGAANVEPDPPYVHRSTEPIYLHAQSSIDPQNGQPGHGVPMSSTASATQSSTTMGGALPSNGSGAGAHRKGFPLAAAAAIGSVLGFLVVSALFWAVWLYLRRRRRAFRASYLPPKRMLSVTSARTVSTIPLFISASEAGVKDENPFKHPRDAEEDDPFDAASLWRSSTTRSSSTLSV